MKIAMFITGILGLTLIALGGGTLVFAAKNEDAQKQTRGGKIAAIGSLFLLAFFILLIILLVQVLFSLAG